MVFGSGTGSSFWKNGWVTLGAVFFAANVFAQTAAPIGSPNPTQAHSPTSTHHVVKKHTKKAVVASPAPVEAVQPLAPPPPDWPANDQAAPASVGWNGHDLSIAATNSSLIQILHDVSTATGVTMEGMSRDQRVFGTYGPAPARDVLQQLLEGSGYNVLMIGDKGQGEPREIVLTAKANHPVGQPAQAQPGQQPQAADEEAPEEPEQPEQPDPGLRRPFNVPPQQPGSGRTPQQMMEEMQQRQQQLQQQMQNNQQQANPQPNE